MTGERPFCGPQARIFVLWNPGYADNQFLGGDQTRVVGWN